MAENQIDKDISGWILEFLLHQPIQNCILDSILGVLPIPDKNPVFSKLLILRKLQSEVSNSNISENVLDLFYIIVELDNCLGIKDCPDSLKKAYCAVAVECTVRCLIKCCNDVKGEFFDVVKRVWRRRVDEMEGKNVGLVSEELLEWKDDIEAAVWEENACLKVVERSKDISAAKAVRVYVEEEKSRMGPSFLELVSKTLKPEGSGNPGGGCTRKRKGIEMVDAEKKNGLARCKKVGYKRLRRAKAGYSRGAKIADVDESGAGQSFNADKIGAPEVEEEQEGPLSSRLGVRATVEDPPLPEALRGTESVVSIPIMSNKDLEPPRDQNIELAGGQDKTKSSEDNMEKPKSGEGNTGNGNCRGQNNAPESLIEQNKTACARNNSTVEPSYPSSIPNTASLRGRRVSPVNIYGTQKQPRKRKAWSPVEEETLRTGVEKFGRGNWQLILYAYPAIFVDRTAVDLKDKWRNMKRYD